ncbi:MAG: YkvA family protein [Lentilitoribacter sp.]
MGKKTISENEINAILSPADIEQQQKQEKKIRRKFWPTLKNALAQLPFSEDVVTAYFCAMDKNTPTHVRGVLLAALAYFVLPTDLIPDFIAMIGFGDDVAVLTVAITTLKKHMTVEQRDAARQALKDLKSDIKDV